MFADLDKKITLLNLKGATVYAFVCDNPYSREVGLSNHVSLPSNEGCLIVFDRPDEHSITTENMRFPIDIIFLDHNYKIVDASLREIGSVINSDSKHALMALEINAGLFDKLNLKIGDRLK